MGLALGDLVSRCLSTSGQAVPVLGLLPCACSLFGDARVLLVATSGAGTAKLARGSLAPHVIDLFFSCQALAAGLASHSRGVSLASILLVK